MSYLKIPEWPFAPDEQAPINEEWEAREAAGEPVRAGAYIQSFEAYQSPVCDDGGAHYPVRGSAEQSRLMNEHDAVDSRDVPSSMMNENVRKTRGYDN